MDHSEIVQLAIDALEDIKAKDILTLDVAKLTEMTDTMIIACGNTPRQNKALAENLVVKAKQRECDILGVEGMDAPEWILVDLGSVIVHIMVPQARETYNLEELWNVDVRPGSKPESTSE